MKRESQRKIVYNLDEKLISFKPEIANKGFGRRVNILYATEEGNKNPLIIAPYGHMIHTYGIQKDTFNNRESGTLSICLCLNRNQEKEEELYDMICSIYHQCLEYVDRNRRELGIKSKENIKTIFKSPLKYEDQETGDVKLYAKFISNKDYSKVWTTIIDIDTQEKINITEHFNKSAKLYPALLFDSIYVTGGNAYLQCKLSEGAIKFDKNNESNLHLDLELLDMNN